MSSTNASIDEVAKFDRLAGAWWDPDGPMRPLHRMNPTRIGWIQQFLPAPAKLLDVGCGAGLAAEALAKLGHDVLGIDAAAEVVAAAEAHAAGMDGLRYRVATTEDLVREGLRFPAITALEVIEHVPNPAAFVQTLAALLEPDGKLFLSTLNRTSRSFLTAKLGAEYVLRMLPAGTHDWRAFLTPAEIARLLRRAGLRVQATTGLTFNALSGQWRTTRDVGVNYMVAAVR